MWNSKRNTKLYIKKEEGQQKSLNELVSKVDATIRGEKYYLMPCLNVPIHAYFYVFIK